VSRYARELDLRELNAHTQGILLTPPGSDVLDVGTADGSPVVQGLRARGCKVWGIEIDEEAAAIAAPLCEEMVVGNVEQLDLDEAFGDRRFDVVLCLDVLEHLVEPLGALRRLSRLLTPTGIVVASIPNVTHAAVRLQLMEGRFRYTDTGLLDRTHLRFFDREEVGALFDSAGLTTLERLEVRREPHETEIRLDLSAVPPEVLQKVTADPDARVFQWVVVARRAVPEVEVDTSGLSTALLQQTGRLERAVRESADHIAWLGEHLATKTAHEQELEAVARSQNERIAELERTLRERVAELVDAHQAVRALQAEVEVAAAYNTHLQASLGLPGGTPATVPGHVGAAHAAVDRAIGLLQQHPRALAAARLAVRAARKVRR
jgi:2-polyprenyl-3-methyl-5-hydroxy-6-metoxy-1,4-benzoquinol methylase